jgi:flagellin-like protein
MNIRKRKAISPLITTLLLIAIAVAASVLTYSWVMSMVGSQSAQAQTQVRIDTVTWLGKVGTIPVVPATDPVTYYPVADGFSLLIRNTGSVSATIESISVRPNKAGSTATTYKPTNPAAVDVGDTLDTSTITFDIVGGEINYDWTVSNSYVIHIVTTTGFYYESVSTTPAVVPVI